MARKSNEEMYFEARNRALSRLTEGKQFRDQSVEGYEKGLTAVLGNGEIPMEILSFICTESNLSFSIVIGILAKLEAVKGKRYGASWQKRGEPGILANVTRKVDRLDVALQEQEDREHGVELPPGESICESLADGAVYCIKWLCRRAQTNPDEFHTWLEGVQKLQ